MTRARQRLIGIALAVVATCLVMVAQRDVGIARDEMVYVGAGAHYADWWADKVAHLFTNTGREDITRTWGGPSPTDNNREHPPLMKTLFGISERVLHEKLGVMDELSADRFPSAVMCGVLVWLVFAFVAEIWGVGTGVLAALLVLFLPRALFHSGLACFDAPMTTLWFATIVAYWRGLRRRWPWQVGVAFGLALATKHNAILLPFAILPHLAHVMWWHAKDRAERWRQARIVVALVVLGPLTLFVLWPWLWIAPVAHVKEWLQFHFTHVHYNFEYLGHNWNAPRFPWHVALVTTLFTVPVATLVAAALGGYAWVRERATNPDRARAPALLLFLSAGVSIGPFLLGSTPIFGAEKHWAPAIPSICIAAAVGCAWAARGLVPVLERWTKRATAIALAVVGGAVVAASVMETAVAEPYALTWYNAAAGGDAGGADLGMNRQFWGVAAKGVLDELAALAPKDPKQVARVYSHDASPAWGMYQKLGLLPKNLPDAGMEQAGIDASQLAIVVHELHFDRHDYMIWKTYGTVQPIYVLRANGVPVVSVYRRQR